MGLLKNLFGVKGTPVPQSVAIAAAAAPPPPLETQVAPGFVELANRRYYEILETYQSRARPLNECVTFDVEEENRLKALRIESYQRQNRTDYRPHDVFHLWPYRAVDPDHVIKRVELKSDAPRPLPQYSQILYVNVVSDRVMRAISALEPGAHAFYPVDIVQADGNVQRYHFMQFLEHTDCTVPMLGGFRRGVREDGTVYWARSSSDDRIFLDAERIGQRHLFFDKRAKSGGFISAELVNRLGDFLPRGLYLTEVSVVRSQR